MSGVEPGTGAAALAGTQERRIEPGDLLPPGLSGADYQNAERGLRESTPPTADPSPPPPGAAALTPPADPADLPPTASWEPWAADRSIVVPEDGEAAARLGVEGGFSPVNVTVTEAADAETGERTIGDVTGSFGNLHVGGGGEVAGSLPLGDATLTGSLHGRADLSSSLAGVTVHNSRTDEVPVIPPVDPVTFRGPTVDLEYGAAAHANLNVPLGSSNHAPFVDVDAGLRLGGSIDPNVSTTRADAEVAGTVTFPRPDGYEFQVGSSVAWNLKPSPSAVDPTLDPALDPQNPIVKVFAGVKRDDLSVDAGYQRGPLPGEDRFTVELKHEFGDPGDGHGSTAKSDAPAASADTPSSAANIDINPSELYKLALQHHDVRRDFADASGRLRDIQSLDDVPVWPAIRHFLDAHIEALDHLALEHITTSGELVSMASDNDSADRAARDLFGGLGRRRA